MRVRRELMLAAVGLAASLAAISGCQDTAKHAVRVRQPAATPQPQSAANGTGKSSSSVQGLPIPSNESEYSKLTARPQTPVDALLAQAQARFDAGQQAYQAGQPDVARKDFNAAAHMLMNSKLEATGDQRLRELFNRIVDTMQSYEMEAEQKDEQTAEENEEAADNDENSDNADNSADQSAAQNADQANAQAAPPESTAPIEEVAELENLPATDPKLAALAGKELITVPHDLPLTLNASVLQYLSFFASPRGRDIVEMGLARAGRYRAMIESTLKKEGLPLDLIYLAQAESAFKPQVISRTGARGVWQFMPYTGEIYGLHHSFWVDERDDPVQATQSAAEMLRDLYATFGDWYLAMAAYNSGPMNVTRAVERTGYADFWKLQSMNALPLQTKNYVPIILALALVAKDPGLYGIQVTPEPAPAMESTKLDHAISLQLVADATGSTLDEVQAMNPELIRGIAPEGFAFNVPKGTAEQLKTEIAGIPTDKLTSWRLVKFAQGDTLDEMARKYHVKLAVLEDANELHPDDPPDAGKMLIVPAAPAIRLTWYRVRRGDTLGRIAAQHHVTTSELREWNHMRGNAVYQGHLLRVYEHGYFAEPGEQATARIVAGRKMARVESASGETLTHRVRAGETLWSIAHMYGMTVDALKAANPFLATRGLEAGDRLNVTPR